MNAYMPTLRIFAHEVSPIVTFKPNKKCIGIRYRLRSHIADFKIILLLSHVETMMININAYVFFSFSLQMIHKHFWPSEPTKRTKKRFGSGAAKNNALQGR